MDQLQLLNSDKDDTIRRHVDMMERNDANVARMRRSVTSLEASLAASRDQLAGKERALAAKIRELESKTEECQRAQQLLESSTEQIRQLQTGLARAEESVSEMERDLSQSSRRVAELEADNTHLRTDLMAISSRLEETKLQLNGAWSEKMRLQNELEQSAKATDELRMELKESREQTRTCEEERQRLESDLLSRDCNRTVVKQLVSATRHSVPVSAAAAVTSTQIPVSAKKLFDVHVKHERSSTSNISPSVTRRDVTDSQQHYSLAPSREVYYIRGAVKKF